MIIEMIMDIVKGLFSNSLFALIDIPNLPPEVYEYVDMLAEYIGMGLGLLSNYTHIEYLLTLFSVILAVDVALLIYNIVMWVLNKIPVANID